MMIRGLRILTALENGVIDGYSLQTRLAADESLRDEFRQVMEILSSARRVCKAKPYPLAYAMTNGTHAANACVASDNFIDQLGTSGPAFEYFTSDWPGLGKLLLRYAGKDFWPVDDVNALMSDVTLFTSVLANAAARALYYASTYGCNRTLEMDTPSNPVIVLAANYTSSSGALFFNSLRRLEGSTASSVLTSAGSLANIAASGSCGAVLTTSPACVKAIAKSAGVRAIITAASACFASFNDASVVKCWAGAAGANIDDYNSVSALTGLAGNTGFHAYLNGDLGARQRLFSSTSLTNAAFANTSFLNAIGTTGNLWTTMQSYPTACAKYIAAILGLDFTAIAADTDLHTSSNWNAILGSTSAKNILYLSDTLLTSMAGSAIALAAVRADINHSIFSAAENNNITLSGPVSGGKYILTGLSHNNTRTSIYTIASGSRRAGTALFTATASGVSDTTAQDAGTAGAPLVAPVSLSMTSSSGSSISYFGMLRVDT